MDEHIPLYTSSYSGFAARERIRQLTYGDDLGQSGWLTADELERFAAWLDLGPGSRLLDVGCGSGGPALRLAGQTGASIVGVDRLEDGIANATRLADEQGVADRVRFVRVDASGRLPFDAGSFDAVISIDVMCHLPNRLEILREWHRVTAPGARVLYTDPTIVTGLITDTEIADRSAAGIYVFSAETLNETLLTDAGFELARREDLTENMSAMAGRWHNARAQFRADLLADEGKATFDGIQRFLASCHLLARERRLSRYAFLARRSVRAH